MRNKIIRFGIVLIAVMVIFNIYLYIEKNGSTPFFKGSATEGATSITENVKNFFLNINPSNYSKVSEENEQLKEQVATLEVENEQLRTENKSIVDSNLLENSSGFEFSVNAKVISRDANSWNEELVIDVGSTSNVEPGMAVINEGYLIGRINKVYDNKATVSLFYNEQFEQPLNCYVKMDDEKVNGYISGYNIEEKSYQFTPLDDSKEIKEDAVVYTNNYNENLASEILIGTVTTIEGDVPNKDIYVKPEKEVENLEYVTVVK